MAQCQLKSDGSLFKLPKSTNLSQVLDLDVLELEVSSLCAEDDAAGGDGHVRHRVLAVVAEAGSLDGRDLRGGKGGKSEFR